MTARLLNSFAFGSLLILAAIPMAHAQYKYVGADGSVTYSDRPPPPDAKQVQKTSTASNVLVASSLDSLPFAVKAAAQKYPITIYTAPDCGPCDQLKAHLQKRGAPFSEKVIRNVTDIAAMKALGFADSSFPALTVGSQKQSGFEPIGLDNLLELAGYPKNIKLPPGFVGGSEPLTPEPVKTAKASPQTANGETVKARPKREPVVAEPTPEPKPLIRF
jgi:glutaredoxin